MSNEIPEETLKKWRGEFEIYAKEEHPSWDLTWNHGCYHDENVGEFFSFFFFGCDEGEKATSKKAQEEIDLYSNAFKTADELRISSAERYNKEIEELQERIKEQDELIEIINECKEDLVRCVTCDCLSEKCHADSFTAAGIIGGEVVERDDWECNHCFEKQELGDQLAKRDQLIEQAKPYVKEKLTSAWGVTKAKEWLKQYEELKK